MTAAWIAAGELQSIPNTWYKDTIYNCPALFTHALSILLFIAVKMNLKKKQRRRTDHISDHEDLSSSCRCVFFADWMFYCPFFSTDVANVHAFCRNQCIMIHRHFVRRRFHWGVATSRCARCNGAVVKRVGEHLAGICVRPAELIQSTACWSSLVCHI
jgi:hypothetical protein